MAGVKEDVKLARVRYDAQTGLVPVVCQDANTNEVLMVAYADREAIKRTLATGYAWYWSRSRRAYWRKGETSGNVQRVVEVRTDCDGDTVLYRVIPEGPACHTGEGSCFYRRVVPDADPNPGAEAEGMRTASAEGGEEGEAPADGARAEVSRGEWDAGALERLWGVIERRHQERPDGSYTTYLFAQGAERIGKKIGEEGVEVALAGLKAERDAAAAREVAAESADLLYHLFVLWRHLGIDPADVWQVLEERA
ncbi:bifunctional phosphoribosyl-AMP cyclohydrolase/phosphoribosyl-ATP diphosphatase HisIE [Alicyclobacillus vulcanalis]|uniref:Histidine biosynthesis bifunctional protein HisIE n=1 Tax=Alicyclobacillus vulcanalis TaxID=252246 RepID=A0A1N7M181_9BACL|nr:bifunctional phosphoribosyl-AMP cyclohydrolase/phosphoribosyl-ATP diphosphatase HisIE [Alicyclobacillus vulcanalis]SIS79813.1 phosphoribosyl-ATP pyrophosphatase /phosphoribosyl-AMP cyclohydrolase [Alicyclobacillus vulcanalis]